VFASRHSLSVLSTIGETDTIASTLEEYREIAVALAQTSRVCRAASGMREKTVQSGLCDHNVIQMLCEICDDVWQSIEKVK